MTLIKWTPLFEPFQDIDRFWEGLPNLRQVSGFVPSLDIYQDKDNVVIEAPLAGVRPEEVKISIENDVLTIEGQAEKKSEVEEKDYYRKEIRCGAFHRSVALPTAVNGYKAKAVYEDGILKIIVPKEERVKATAVKIEIKKKKSCDKQYAKDKALALVESDYKYKLGIYLEFNTGMNYKIFTESIVTIATFSDSDYNEPNQKLLNMLNTLGKNNLALKGSFLKYLSREQEDMLVQHFNLYEAPENIEVRDTYSYWLEVWLNNLTQDRVEKILKRKLIF